MRKPKNTPCEEKPAKPISKYVKASVNLPREVVAQAQAQATRSGMTFQAFVCEAVVEKLARCKPVVE